MPTAIVTGASRGLGLALADALAERGWRLVIDARDGEDLGALPQRRRGRRERDALARVDHEPPPPLGERLGEREPEAARSAGDDGCGHTGHATSRPARFPSAIGPRTSRRSQHGPTAG